MTFLYWIYEAVQGVVCAEEMEDLVMKTMLSGKEKVG